MRIGYVLVNFPALSETFIRREVLALCRAGQRVFVYTHYRHRDPLVPEPREANLTIREVPFLRDPAALARAIRADGVEHLHGSLMLDAHRATHAAARTLGLPFTLTAYSGHDVFAARDPQLYRAISADPLCGAIVVEDPFMRDWVGGRLGADPAKLVIIPNSFDLELYRLPAPRGPRERVVILAIARFVEKKGLIHLVEAFRRVGAARPDVELRLVGRGPEEARLRRAAAGDPRIVFPGALSEAETRPAYADSDIFCLPCVQTAGNDADGVPTTTLEAMAFELPVVTSDLLSTPHYVRHRREGLLTAPGDTAAIAAALGELCADAALRDALGRAGRARVAELCDLGRNSARLLEVMRASREGRWRANLAALERHRATYTAEREGYYRDCRERAAAFFAPRGRLLDVGCGGGQLRAHLGPDVTYVGCDPLVTARLERNFPFAVARGEALPFRDGAFDGVVLYAVLPHVLDVDAVLAEAGRVLRPGGYLYLQECVDDPNPLHLNHLTEAELRARVSRGFGVEAARPGGPHLLLLKARKGEPPPAVPRAPADAAPLVSVAITTYNRARYLRDCLDSVLRQTYRPLEVVVVDDGSTDDTRRILAEYGPAVRVAHHDRRRGIAQAKNRALRMTSEAARYVAVLDSDDCYAPRFVERCVALLERAPDVGLVYADDILIDAAGRELRRQPAVEPWSVEAWLRTCNLRGDTWVARRELVMRTALHDEALEYDVDYDLFYQLLELTTFAHLPEYLVYVRQHGERTTRNRLGLAKCHAANLVKYGYSPQYAYLRARGHPEWLPAIEEGIALGKELRERRAASRPAGAALV